MEAIEIPAPPAEASYSFVAPVWSGQGSIDRLDRHCTVWSRMYGWLDNRSSLVTAFEIPVHLRHTGHVCWEYHHLQHHQRYSWLVCLRDSYRSGQGVPSAPYRPRLVRSAEYVPPAPYRPLVWFSPHPELASSRTTWSRGRWARLSSAEPQRSCNCSFRVCS